MNEFLLLINPAAASGRARKKRGMIEEVLRRGDEPFRVEETKRAGHATELVREALRDRVSGVAVVGGDGTLSEALGGFFDEEGNPVRPGAWIAPLPCGTGGDFRKTIYPRQSLASLVAGFHARQPQPLDVGWIEYIAHDGTPEARPFLNIASFGLGGLVDRLVNEGPKALGGRLAFALGTLRALGGYQGAKVRYTVDDRSHTANVANVAIANGQFFGGGMHIAPLARIDDGLFDVVALPWHGAMRQVGMAKDLYGGTILNRATMQRGALVEAESLDEQEVLLDIDGEAPGRLPARFSLRRDIVRLR